MRVKRINDCPKMRKGDLYMYSSACKRCADREDCKLFMKMKEKENEKRRSVGKQKF